MRYDLVLKNAHTVTPFEEFRADIGVKAGKIAALAAPNSLGGEEEIDCASLVLISGVIDAHVHTRYPERPDREDFASGTKAAAAGGITTILNMPGSNPIIHSGEILKKRVELLSPHAHTDFGMYGGAGGDNLKSLAGLKEAGAIAFKTFLNPPSREKADPIYGLYSADDATTLKVCEHAARTGLVGAFHTESHTICTDHTERLIAEARNDPRALAEARPEIAEVAAAASLLAIAEQTGHRVHISHVSTPRCVEMAHQARSRGARITLETCPHYLFADIGAFDEHGTRIRMSPPLRAKASVDALWRCLEKGLIDIVASDHAPYLIEDKNKQHIFDANPGIPGLETILPLMLNAVSECKLGMRDVARLLSYNPARIFGLYPRKGALLIGSDADFTIVDPKALKTVDRTKMHTKARDTALLFDGRRLVGWPVYTIVRGKPVARESEIVGPKGYGKFLSNTYSHWDSGCE